MHTENFKSSSNIPNFKAVTVPNNAAGTKLSDIYGTLHSALSTYQQLPGATEEGWNAVFGAAMTIFGAAGVAASGKAHGNA